MQYGKLYNDRISVMLAAVLLLQHAEMVESKWSYAATEKWGLTYPSANGKMQSPIDIANVDTSDEHTDFSRQLKLAPLTGRKIANNGYNEQVNGNFGSLELPDGRYDALQFHLHFPSEHTFNHAHADGEMHVVFKKRDGPGIAVLALLLDVDGVETEGEFFPNLGLGKELPSNGSSKTIADAVDLSVFDTTFSGQFYHYVGSLTTPPCTEGVHWYVFGHRVFVSDVQVDSFKKLFPDPENNRPTQPLNGRKVVKNSLRVDDDEFGESSVMGGWGLWIVIAACLLLVATFGVIKVIRRRSSADLGSTCDEPLVTNEI
jgi:carbonic anhydrase|eukprot:TRINITY_DN3893_c0_g1_i1.p1 TRINITY_DN3893_c0_g1~~TRINITY_DN3893_c0_g1_i1.p1  ORF type:complete len:316 (-),score=52.56 TRINITY_DN3893_c0_g1_i1:116-1063(-)